MIQGRRIQLVWIVGFLPLLSGCGKSSASAPSLSALMVQALPAGLKTAGTATALSTRASSLPQVTVDSDLANVISIFWNPTTNAPSLSITCSAAELSDGTCVDLTAQTGHVFKKPYPTQSPGGCNQNGNQQLINSGTSELQAACKFDQETSFAGDLIHKCAGSAGFSSFSLSHFIPWAASWGIPATLTMQGASGGNGETVPTDNTDGGLTYDYQWFQTQPPANTGFSLMNLQPPYFVNFGYRNATDNRFFFITASGTGSKGGNGVIAFQGVIPDASGPGLAGSFEYYHGGGNPPNSPVYRAKSDGKYIYWQAWPDATTLSSGQVSSPPTEKCYKIGATISDITAAAGGLGDCAASFSTTVATMEQDSSFAFRILLYADYQDVGSNWSVGSAATNTAVGGNFGLSPSAACY